MKLENLVISCTRTIGVRPHDRGCQRDYLLVLSGISSQTSPNHYPCWKYCQSTGGFYAVIVWNGNSRGSDRYTRKMRDCAGVLHRWREISMSKHQAILDYLENYQLANVSVWEYLELICRWVMGTAYRAIKEAENRGIVETRPRSGTVSCQVQGCPRTSFREL